MSFSHPGAVLEHGDRAMSKTAPVESLHCLMGKEKMNMQTNKDTK